MRPSGLKTPTATAPLYRPGAPAVPLLSLSLLLKGAASAANGEMGGSTPIAGSAGAAPACSAALGRSLLLSRRLLLLLLLPPSLLFLLPLLLLPKLAA